MIHNRAYFKKKALKKTAIEIASVICGVIGVFIAISIHNIGGY